MFSTSDTIVAIATPPGRGGIGVVRISGPDAHRIAREITTYHDDLTPRQATLVKIGGTRGEGGGREGALDEAIATRFPAPHSYTAEEVVEISAHGSPAVLRAIVEAAVASGARVAEPGEFTLRAFLNGRIDLLQAEAVADLVDAVTPLQARVAFDQLEGTLTRRIAALETQLFELIARLEASVDFPEEGYQFIGPSEIVTSLRAIDSQLASLATDARVGRIVREGAQVSIVGRPNVGKSSVFNALVGVSRAIVTDVPGTTRDLVTETVDIDGLKITLVDTAGQHETIDQVEAIGVDLARQAQRVSDLILVVLDRSHGLRASDRIILETVPCDRRIVVANKTDLLPAWSTGCAVTVAGHDDSDCRAQTTATRDHPDLNLSACVEISAVTGSGVRELRSAIVRALDRDNVREQPGITNIRHAALVERARAAVGRAIDGLADSPVATLPEEFVLADLQEARGALEEVVGRRAPEELLAHIFSRFCIGK